jgi:ADP-glucose pyrophosphorylase
MALNDTQKQVLDIIRQETGTMAYTYENALDIVKAIKMYINFNIDAVAGEDIGQMTLDDIEMLLEGKVEQYQKFVKTEKPGIYTEIRRNETF